MLPGRLEVKARGPGLLLAGLTLLYWLQIWRSAPARHVNPHNFPVLADPGPGEARHHTHICPPPASHQGELCRAADEAEVVL